MRIRVLLFALLALAAAPALARLQVGQTAPNFTLPDTAGVNHQLSEFRGQVVLLNFWAST
jgi:hypothetical protein